MAATKVLVVDDEIIIAREIEDRLARLGYQVLGIASSGQEAVSIAEQARPDLVLMDIVLKGDRDGVETADEFRRRWRIPIVYLTAHADDATLQRARVTEPFGYIVKPFTERELRANIEMALYKHEAESKLEELRALVYSMSHNLRAPLRAMAGFSSILLRDYSAQLGDQPRRYVQNVRDNAERIGDQIDNLLAYLRLGYRPILLQPVAPAEIVRDVLRELDAEQEGRDVKVSIGELPLCRADPALLKEVWTNLVSNALKYTRTREVAMILIGHRYLNDDPAEPLYFIKDNGIGFDIRYSDRLFGVFQRLRTAEEYEGTGVGLAVVKRIVELHGGRVWAEGEVNRGATFYFTLGGGHHGLDVRGADRHPAGGR